MLILYGPDHKKTSQAIQILKTLIRLEMPRVISAFVVHIGKVSFS